MKKREDLIKDIKCQLSTLEMYNNTRSEMLLKNDFSIDAIKEVDDTIRSIEESIFQVVGDLKKQDEKCNCDGVSEGCSSDMCNYHYVNLNNNTNKELDYIITTSNDININKRVKSSDFDIFVDIDGVKQSDFFGYECNGNKLYLYLYDIDHYKDNNSVCLPSTLQKMLDDKESFNVDVLILNTEGLPLYYEEYIDVVIDKFERYSPLFKNISEESRFIVECTFRVKNYSLD